LEIQGLSKHYGSTCAIDDLSLEIRRGEVVGLIGPNGAGKTTTLKCLAGLVKPNSGSILVHSVDITKTSNQPGVLGFLYEIDALPNDMLVKRFLLAEAFALGLAKQEVDRVIKETSLQNLQNKTIRTLSMGNKRRVGIAAALLPNSDLLILDEPTNGLDIDGLRLIRSAIDQRKRQKKSVLFSSHTMSEIERVVDRVIVIKHGRKIFDGGLPELQRITARSGLEDAYEYVLSQEASW